MTFEKTSAGIPIDCVGWSAQQVDEKFESHLEKEAEKVKQYYKAYARSWRSKHQERRTERAKELDVIHEMTPSEKAERKRAQVRACYERHKDARRENARKKAAELRTRDKDGVNAYKRRLRQLKSNPPCCPTEATD